MKTIAGTTSAVLLMLSIVTPMNANADSSDLCNSLNRMAKTIMEIRQSGISMADYMSILEETAIQQETTVSSWLKDIVIQAYSEPAYGTESVKASAITEFANSVYLDCIKDLKELEGR